MNHILTYFKKQFLNPVASTEENERISLAE